MILTRLASRISDSYTAHIFWRKVERALALHRRGEARSDGLQLTLAKTTLRVEWLARDVHPWDRGLPAVQSERLFAEQCLADTDAAISRLFAEIPVLDAIEVRVRRQPSQPPLLAGIVHRKDLREPSPRSTSMRLRSLGLMFRMVDLQLEQISE